MKKLLLFIPMVFLLAFACKTSEKKGSLKNAFVGSWMHSHEDNIDITSMVYRPSTYKFPPARGRVSLTINEDGTCQKTTIAPTDGYLKFEGKWTYDKKTKAITFTWDNTGKSEIEKLPETTDVWIVAEATKEKLVLKRK